VVENASCKLESNQIKQISELNTMPVSKNESTQAADLLAKELTKVDAKLALSDHIVSTSHTLKLKARTLRYTATCGTVIINEDQEKDGVFEGTKPKAQMFFVAYTLQGVKDSAMRPLLFSFNGGPGSSSVWLHLGIAGPKRVPCDAMGNPLLPHRLVDNEHTLLTEADIVFIDPIGTGFSRMVEGEKTKEFHDYQRDIESVGEFIRLYLSRNNRWNSPKFLMGESYGTTRAAGLSNHLQEKHGIALNGVALVSCAVEFQTLLFDHGNDLPYVIYLPTYAATAWYHKALAPELQKQSLAAVVAAAEKFANDTYHVALLKGARITSKEREDVAQQVALYSGLSKEFLLNCNLRVSDTRFFKELLRSRGQVVGRLDSRFIGYDKDSGGETMESDPSFSGLLQAYSSCINQYLRDELNFTQTHPYNVIASLWDKWSYKAFSNKYVNVGDSLRQAMHGNPNMKVYVASGYYDLATPHASGDFTLAHLGLHESLRQNIRVRYYESGHLMYVHKASLEQMGKDLRQLLKS
jgi:carboxypeptidase C (cathepsin A)